MAAKNFPGIRRRPSRHILTMWKITGYALSILSLGLGAIMFARQSEPSAQPGDGRDNLAPRWELRDLDGKVVSSDQFKGKVVILDFWATWCPPCRAEIPGFVELQKTYGEKGLVVVGVSFDRDEPAAVKKFVERFGMNYPVLRGTGQFAETFGGVSALPTTFIIDRQGRIVATHVGFTERQEFEDAIKPLL
ncbi:MAG: TlpA family protein disulfide reductase [Opitutae bacterium]|nr:TlpA family protein disulfide reductase [Opitutae bacterium]